MVLLLCTLVALLVVASPAYAQESLPAVLDRLSYPFIAVTLLLLAFALFIAANHSKWAKFAAARSVERAKAVAGSLWRVSAVEMAKGSLVLMFRHYSFSTQGFYMWVRPGHPDLEAFKSLRPGDVVEFEPLSEGLECALDNELCGFLRIKEVTV